MNQIIPHAHNLFSKTFRYFPLPSQNRLLHPVHSKAQKNPVIWIFQDKPILYPCHFLHLPSLLPRELFKLKYHKGIYKRQARFIELFVTCVATITAGGLAL